MFQSVLLILIIMKKTMSASSIALPTFMLIQLPEKDTALPYAPLACSAILFLEDACHLVLLDIGPRIQLMIVFKSAELIVMLIM